MARIAGVNIPTQKRVVIDGRFVRDKLGTILEREDLSKFIL